jgi:hypothetical protein
MNDAAIDFLAKKITGLQVIQHELTHIYTGITDLDLADEIRGKLTSLNATLFALQSALNSLKASTAVVPKPSDNEINGLTSALQQLDAYVRNDENVHMALNYLMQVMTLINQA